MKKKIVIILISLSALIMLTGCQKNIFPDASKVELAQLRLINDEVYQLSDEDTKFIVSMLNSMESDKRYKEVDKDDIMTGFQTMMLTLKTSSGEFEYWLSGYDFFSGNKHWRIETDYFAEKCFPVLYEVADKYKVFGGEICDTRWQGTIKDIENGKEYDINELAYYPSYVIVDSYTKVDKVDFSVKYVVEMKNMFKDYTVQIGNDYVTVNGVCYKYDRQKAWKEEICGYISELIKH